MAARRIVTPREHLPNSSTPSQEDEADILEEVGGERDDGGELIVDEDVIQAVGAVDAASVRENRRMENVVKKKRGGMKGVVFNTDDLLTKYEGIIKEWPPNTLDISVKRLTGTAVTHTILSRPRSGVELYEAIKGVHGQYEEAQYEVKFLDSNQKQYRGTGRITMPDTRPVGQQGQPVQQPYYPPNGAPPPGYPPQAQPWQPPQHPTTAQPPIVQATDPIAMMRQMFDMFQTMSQRPQPQTSAPAALTPQVNPTDPMAMMKQMFEMFQQTQGGAVPPPAPQPVVIAPPPSPPQPVIDPMAMMTQMFELFTKMQASMAPRQALGPRPSYYPQGDRGEAPPYARPAYQGREGPPAPPQRQLTAAEQFRESMGVVRSAVSVVEEMRSMLPGQEQQESFSPPDDDDSPVVVTETGVGKVKLIHSKSDGSLRWAETGATLLPDLLKWIGEQREAIQKETAERRQRQQPQRQQLPPGYVEVGPDYTPPPGFVAVPVDQQDLPPPPENVPPPIQSSPRAAWGAPTIPSEDQEGN